jgi:hypothetical protein
MSDTLIEFAQPLLSELPEGAGEVEWRIALNVASLVWNGLIVGWPEAKLVTELRPGLGPDVNAEGLVAELARLKSTKFANDPRFIVEVLTHKEGSQVHVTALTALAR